MMKAPLTPAVHQEVSAAHRGGKQETDFSLDKGLNKKHTPVKASLNQSCCSAVPPASLLSWRKDKKNIIDSNLWPSNQERTCEGEWFADEGDIKETKPG